MNRTELVRVAGASKSFGPQVVLDDVDLVVHQGEFVAILGRSGSGKSTLINLIGGLERPDAGEIHVDGARVDRMSESRLARFRRRRIAFVFQSFNLLPHLTAIENVTLAARLNRTGGRRAAEALLEQLGVAHVMGKRPGQLSGGEQQRVAIARAAVARPKLLLADEPTGSLDSASAKAVIELLTMVHDGEMTIVTVTHAADVARSASRVVTISDGVVAHDDERKSSIAEPEEGLGVNEADNSDGQEEDR